MSTNIDLLAKDVADEIARSYESAIRNWNRAKARKDRRRTRYWSGVCLRLQRNGH